MIENFRIVLREFPTIYEPLHLLGRKFRQRPIRKKIGKCLAVKESVFFVQVGSNDGIQGDPLHNLIIKHPNWRGMFIEPVPFLFERLKRNYQYSDRFTFENVAISTETKATKFYYVSELAKVELGRGLPDWHDQLGSFNRDHILKHLEGRLEPYIVEEEIESITLQELFDRNHIKTIDLLHIDTEGFDYKVLSQVDFSRYHPSAVLYEHKHLSAEEKHSAESLLKKHNYRWVSYKNGDTLALRKS